MQRSIEFGYRGFEVIPFSQQGSDNFLSLLNLPRKLLHVRLQHPDSVLKLGALRLLRLQQFLCMMRLWIHVVSGHIHLVTEYHALCPTCDKLLKDAASDTFSASKASMVLFWSLTSARRSSRSLSELVLDREVAAGGGGCAAYCGAGEAIVAGTEAGGELASTRVSPDSHDESFPFAIGPMANLWQDPKIAGICLLSCAAFFTGYMHSHV